MLAAMSGRDAVDWTPLPAADAADAVPESLRERKKRLTRQQLSATATRLFVERGFDAVRVRDVAAACGVSEKTVFNYFPTKEALLLDRWETTMASLRIGLADPAVSPVDAARRILAHERDALVGWLAAQDDPVAAAASVRRFGELVRTTPSLRAHQSDAVDQLVGVAAEVLAGRSGLSRDDPEPRIAATALLGLWHVQFRGLDRYLDGTRTPSQVAAAITDDVERAARLLDDGLASFGVTRASADAPASAEEGE